MSSDSGRIRATTRRRFLIALGGLFGATGGFAGAFAWASRRYHGMTPKLEAVRRRLTRAAYGDVPVALAITRHYDYLRLDPDGVERFVRDYADWRSADGSAESIEDVLSRFLLSTDFFLHDADESRPIRYLRLYDPYLSPCNNPFVRARVT